jgi:hypothetical protein
VSTFDNLVDDVLQTLQGYGLAQSRAAFVASPVASGDKQITVGDATGFEQGVAEIGNEIIFIKSVDYGSNVLTLAPDGRGFYGTTPASYAIDQRITMAPTWPRTRVAAEINATILGTYPTLFGVGTTTFTYSPVITTYGLPVDAEKVLKVTADTIGPSNEQAVINRYSFNSVAPVGDFVTGNSITLETGAFPGRSVTVTYAKQPSEITFGQSFTASGLAESAKRAIKYGACSALISYMDSARLPVDTAQADEYDPSRAGVGTASRISAQLYQRYLVELENERKRLRAATPIPFTVRTR